MIHRNIKYIYLIILLTFAALLLVNCSGGQNDENSEIAARVNDKIITVQEVLDLIPSYLSDAEKKSYSEKIVEKWVVEQILYQNSLKNGTVLTDIQITQIERLTISYIIQNFMDVQSSAENIKIRDNEINQYYEKHKDDYRFDKPVYHIYQLMLETWDKEIADEIKKASDLMATMNKYRLQSRPGEPVVNGDLGFVEVASLNPKIARVLKYKKEDDVTTSIKIDGKYFFIELVEKKKPGDYKPVKLVKSEIVTMLNMRHKSKHKEDLVKKLRSDFIIETFLSKLK